MVVGVEGVASAETAFARVGQSITGLGTKSTAMAAAMGGAVGVLVATALPGLIEAIGSVATSAFDAAESYDKAFDKMRVATGLIGEDAVKLQGVFRDVFTSIPTTTEKAAEAVATLHQRLHVSGEDLKVLATQQLELARITNTNLTQQLNQTTRLLNDWQVKRGQEKETLDFVFKISQQTGVAITDIAAKMVQYGAPLRELGIPFEQAAAMIAKFQAEGVNMGTALSGLRLALSSFAKDGVTNAADAFQKLIDKIKDAPTDMERVGLASAAFGKKAGPDMAELIKQGRLGVEDLVKTVKDSSETILKAAEDTNDFGESWTVMGNKITDALVPLGDMIRGFIADMIKGIQDLYTAYQENWGNIKSTVDQAVKDIGGFYKDHKTEIDALATGVAAATGLMIKVWAETVTPILESLSTITLAMRVAAGDWGAAWKQFNEMAKKEQEKSNQQATDWLAFLGSKLKSFGETWRDQWLKILFVTVDVWAKIKSGAKAAWDGIADSIIGPIKRAYDFLKGLNWREIFENLTMAAKLGLKPGSPPQAARWILEIGDAALKAAAQAQRSVPQYADAFGGITAAASQHLPKIAGLFLELGSTVIKVLEDLKVKVPKVLDDIFGSVKSSSGKGSKAGKDAEDTGSSLGNMLVAGFGAALEGVKGIAAGQAQGGIIGRLQGTLSGALAGAQIGAMFGGGLGAAIGAGVGGIAGFFLSAPTELQKAQAAAQLQQAKDAIKLSMQSVLKGAQEVIQSGIATFNKAIEFFGNLDEYTNVRKEKFRVFFANLSRLMDYFMELAKKFAGQSLSQLKAVAETIGPIVTAIAGLPLAFEGINKHISVPERQFVIFFEDLDELMTRFFERSEVWIDGTAKRAMRVANRLSPVIGLFSPLIEAIKGMGDIKRPTDEAFDTLFAALDTLTRRTGDAANLFDKALLKNIQNFSDKVSPATALWGQVVESIKGMVDIVIPPPSAFNAIFFGIEKIVVGMSDLAGILDVTAVEKAKQIAEASLSIFASIKAGVEALTALNTYKGAISDTFTAFLNDFNQAVDMVTQMSTRAKQFELVARVFEQYIGSGAANLNHAFAMLQQIMTAAGGFFPGGNPSETNTVGTTSTTGNLGTMSVGPTATSQTAGRTTNITINGMNLSGNDAKTEALKKALEDIIGVGVGIDATSAAFA